MMCFDVIAPTVGYDGTLHDHDGRRLELCETTIKKYGRPMLFLEAIVGCEADETTTNSERWRASAAVTKEMARRGLGVIDEDKSPRLGTWRRFRYEVARMHAALEILGWDLTDEEQALVDAIDHYAAQAPARYVAMH